MERDLDCILMEGVSASKSVWGVVVTEPFKERVKSDVPCGVRTQLYTYVGKSPGRMLMLGVVSILPRDGNSPSIYPVVGKSLDRIRIGEDMNNVRLTIYLFTSFIVFLMPPRSMNILNNSDDMVL